MRLVLTSVIILLIGAVLVQMVAKCRASEAGPAINEVTRHYQGKSVEETGATNIITASILDYRAYETLGEATVLFAGIAAVLATLTSHGGKREG